MQAAEKPETLHEDFPGFFMRNQQYRVAVLLYKYFLSGKLELLGKSDGLRSTILEKLGSLHSITSLFNIYHDIYRVNLHPDEPVQSGADCRKRAVRASTLLFNRSRAGGIGRDIEQQNSNFVYPYSWQAVEHVFADGIEAEFTIPGRTSRLFVRAQAYRALLSRIQNMTARDIQNFYNCLALGEIVGAVLS